LGSSSILRALFRVSTFMSSSTCLSVSGPLPFRCSMTRDSRHLCHGLCILGLSQLANGEYSEKILAPVLPCAGFSCHNSPNSAVSQLPSC
jgi:hypothetical protein